MQKVHPLDRLMRAIRAPLILSLLVTLPVATITYGHAIAGYILSLPFWMGLIVGVVHFSALLGISSLIDMQRERRQR